MTEKSWTCWFLLCHDVEEYFLKFLDLESGSIPTSNRLFLFPRSISLPSFIKIRQLVEDSENINSLEDAMNKTQKQKEGHAYISVRDVCSWWHSVHLKFPVRAFAPFATHELRVGSTLVMSLHVRLTDTEVVQKKQRREITIYLRVKRKCKTSSAVVRRKNITSPIVSPSNYQHTFRFLHLTTQRGACREDMCLLTSVTGIRHTNQRKTTSAPAWLTNKTS